jgi:hypothetical protein
MLNYCVSDWRTVEVVDSELTALSESGFRLSTSQAADNVPWMSCFNATSTHKHKHDRNDYSAELLGELKHEMVHDQGSGSRVHETNTIDGGSMQQHAPFNISLLQEENWIVNGVFTGEHRRYDSPMHTNRVCDIHGSAMQQIRINSVNDPSCVPQADEGVAQTEVTPTIRNHIVVVGRDPRASCWYRNYSAQHSTAEQSYVQRTES